MNRLDANIDVPTLDPAGGTLLTVQTRESLPPGCVGEPWAAGLHLTPDGRFLYASERRSNTFAGFRVDAANGALLGKPRTASASTRSTANGRARQAQRVPAGQHANWIALVALRD